MKQCRQADRVPCDICGFCGRCRIHQSRLMRCPACQPNFITKRNQKARYIKPKVKMEKE